jgi:hypothetical protein
VLGLPCACLRRRGPRARRATTGRTTTRWRRSRRWRGGRHRPPGAGAAQRLRQRQHGAAAGTAAGRPGGTAAWRWWSRRSSDANWTTCTRWACAACASTWSRPRGTAGDVERRPRGSWRRACASAAGICSGTSGPGDLPRLLRWQAATGLCFVLDHLAGLHATLPPTDPAWATARALAEAAPGSSSRAGTGWPPPNPMTHWQPQLQHAVRAVRPPLRVGLGLAAHQLCRRGAQLYDGSEPGGGQSAR